MVVRERTAGLKARGVTASRATPGRRATRPADTEPTNIVARLVDSAIVAARAPCRVKCSVVTKVTAAGRGSVPSLPLVSLPVIPTASFRSAALSPGTGADLSEAVRAMPGEGIVFLRVVVHREQFPGDDRITNLGARTGPAGERFPSRRREEP